MFIVPLLLLSISVEYSSSLTIFGTGTKLPSFRDRLISTNILEVVEYVGNVSDCLRHCLHDEKCVSVFYRTTQRQCQLHDVLFLSPEDGVEDSGTEYFSLTSGSCPAGYINARNLNLCYRNVLKKIPYSQIVEDCESRGEHLIFIDSQAKQDHVEKQIVASSGATKINYYIDGMFSQSTRKWTSHDGSDMTYFSWGIGLPTLPTSSSSGVIILKVKSQPFFWSDDVQSPDKYFMCQRDI